MQAEKEYHDGSASVQNICEKFYNKSGACAVMPRLKKVHENREKLEETVKAAEDLIALLRQFRVPVDREIIRRVKDARKHLNETASKRRTRQPPGGV